MNRPRGADEGRRSITRYEQRMYAEQLKKSPHRAAMKEAAGAEAFAHYLRVDVAGARPIPPDLLDDWVSRGWLAAVDPPVAGRCPAPVPAVVCDPFSGSGTTLSVARELNRRSVGCELNLEYHKLIARRMLSTDQPLF